MKKALIYVAVASALTAGFVCDGISQTRIRFVRGRTSATVGGTLYGGGMRRYVLRANQGQQLSGNVSSGNGCVKFTEGSTTEAFTTVYGDNWLSVTNYCSRSTRFTLTVSILY